MISRRHALGWATLAAFAAFGFPAHAEPLFKSLTPLLIELPGWTADKADGMSMDMGDTKMTSASRNYHKGDARIEVAVMVGPAAEGALGAITMGMNVETSEGHMLKAELKGLKALKSFNNNDKSGGVLVALGEQAMFNFSYNGIVEDDAVALAEKFDWKAMQSLAAAK